MVMRNGQNCQEFEIFLDIRIQFHPTSLPGLLFFLNFIPSKE